MYRYVPNRIIVCLVIILFSMDLLCINIALQFALSVSTYNGWISLWNGVPISLPVVSTLFSLIWFVAAQFFSLIP